MDALWEEGVDVGDTVCRRVGAQRAKFSLFNTPYVYMYEYLGSVCFGSVVCVLFEMFMVFHVTQGNERNACYVWRTEMEVGERACLLTR